jgi:beta-lactamase regulating signal transducer with metallopeptidase domain
MTAVVQLSELPPVHALGWMLLHFCWQGSIVAIILACALRLIPLRASRLRYSIACAAMAFMVMLPAITFCVLETNTQPKPQRFAIAVAAEDFGRALNNRFDQSAGPWTVRFERVLNQSLPAVIGFWFAGVLFLLCRLNLGLMATRKMKSLAGESTSSDIQHLLRALRIRLGIQRTVKLLNSARVQAPTVIGWLSPAILFPVGCLAGLSTLQIEAILAHELAHIRRHDYLVNLFQSVIETVLFYHPAVWWVSNQIRREREHCCDDLAVTVCGDRLAYAKALSSLEERRSPIPAGAFGATGGVLKMRIARLLGFNQPPIFSRTAAALLLVLAATTAGLTVWGSAQAQSTSSQKGATSNQSSSAKSQINPQNGVSPADTAVQVRSLTIESNDLPESDRVEIVQAFQGSTYPLEELIERIRRNVQDSGHVKATVKLLQPASSPTGQPSQSMNVSVRVSAGAVYTLSGISVEGAQALSQDEIIQQFPLHPGDLFNATAIGEGLDRLRKLYGSKGYFSFQIIPRLQTDDVRHTATLILDIKEGKPTAG